MIGRVSGNSGKSKETDMKSKAAHRQATRSRTSTALRLTLAGGALTTIALASTTQLAYSDSYKSGYRFQDIVNTNDPTFNQELGINIAGVIAGYFGSGAGPMNGSPGHPNKAARCCRHIIHRQISPMKTSLARSRLRSPGSTIEVRGILTTPSNLTARSEARRSASGPI